MSEAVLRHIEADYRIRCGCRSVGECSCNDWAWYKAIAACVDDFAEHMKSKLCRKFLEGKSGWDDPKWPRGDILRQLQEHIDKGDMVDVANFAMFAWNQVTPTDVSHLSPQPETPQRRENE